MLVGIRGKRERKREREDMGLNVWIGVLLGENYHGSYYVLERVGLVTIGIGGDVYVGERNIAWGIRVCTERKRVVVGN